MGLGSLNHRRLNESSSGRTSLARGRQFYRRVEYQPEEGHMQSSVPVVPFKPALETKG